MGVKLGSTDIANVYIGDTQINKIYQGSTEVYSAFSGPLISLTDLQLYFPFNGTAVDESGNANTLTQTPTSFGTGKFGQALFVNNTAANAALLTSKVWGVTNAFSVAAWVYTPIHGSDKHILSNDGDNAPYPRVWQFRISNGGQLQFVRFDTSGSVDVITGATTLPIDTWIHVAATFSTTNGSKIYVNGVEDGSYANLTTTVNYDSQPTIGSSPSSYNSEFPGSIDEAILYSRELTPTEISTLAAGTYALIT